MRKKQTLPRKGSQAREAYEYMKKGHSLTTIEAIERFGMLRLPNRISELRNKYGVKVYQRPVRSKTKHNVKWEEYSLHPFEQEGTLYIDNDEEQAS